MAENNTNAPLIETSAVGFTYQGSETPALQDVTLSIGAGECVLLCGKSGCGKTTTLKMINRLIKPTTGEIYIGGENIRDKDILQLRRSMGYVIQQTGLFSHMTIRENIEIIPRLSKADPERTRTRTLELMDTANRTGGLVVGTGDLSELALGWATYNGDHMSMYGVNAGVPKTLVRHLVRYEADIAATDALRTVLLDILDTPVSPELLPAKDGEIAQKTEDLVGPYELHDFYLYQVLRFGFGPAKIFRLAKAAFAGRPEYPDSVLYKWLRNFYWRFFAQQFKRSCLPDGPKVGSVTLSPRGDWRMPSDACAALWLAELEQLQIKD